MTLEYIPALKMYRSTTPPPAPAELRAWVENPFEILESDPAFLLCEVYKADAKSKTAMMREVESCNIFMIEYSKIHVVHSYLKRLDKVMYVYGEIPC